MFFGKINLAIVIWGLLKKLKKKREINYLNLEIIILICRS